MGEVAGYVGDTDDYADRYLDQSALMRLVGAAVDHWQTLDWLDLYWDVELRKPHPEVDGLRSTWCYGPSHSTDGEYEAGDLKVADTLRNRLLLWWRLRKPKFMGVKLLPLGKTH